MVKLKSILAVLLLVALSVNLITGIVDSFNTILIQGVVLLIAGFILIFAVGLEGEKIMDDPGKIARTWAGVILTAMIILTGGLMVLSLDMGVPTLDRLIDSPYTVHLMAIVGVLVLFLAHRKRDKLNRVFGRFMP